MPDAAFGQWLILYRFAPMDSDVASGYGLVWRISWMRV